jgi:hypothetical protein
MSGTPLISLYYIYRYISPPVRYPYPSPPTPKFIMGILLQLENGDEPSWK